jgi:hypothetical protein
MIENHFKRRAWYDLLPDYELDVYEPNLIKFFETMYQRQEVWYNRFILQKEPPWCDDEIIANFKFTNVYRELDRASQFLIKNYLLGGEDVYNLVWNIILYRTFNNPETWQAIEMPTYEDYNEGDFVEKIDKFRRAGGNPFTNAYMSTTGFCIGEEKHLAYSGRIAPLLHSYVEPLVESIREAEAKGDPEIYVKKASEILTVARFMAHEFYQDFCYTAIYSDEPVFKKFDRNTWTNVGPGASTGVRLIFPNCETKKEQTEKLYLLLSISNDYLPDDFKYVEWNREKKVYDIQSNGSVNLHSIEMWLCEFQKYWKMEVGKGKARSKFSSVVGQKPNYFLY